MNYKTTIFLEKTPKVRPRHLRLTNPDPQRNWSGRTTKWHAMSGDSRWRYRVGSSHPCLHVQAHHLDKKYRCTPLSGHVDLVVSDPDRNFPCEACCPSSPLAPSVRTSFNRLELRCLELRCQFTKCTKSATICPWLAFPALSCLVFPLTSPSAAITGSRRSSRRQTLHHTVICCPSRPSGPGAETPKVRSQTGCCGEPCVPGKLQR